jgi:SAM-dependent methyltransferase
VNLQIKKCPICKGVKRELLFDFKNALQFIHNEYNLFEMKKYQCLECAHIYTAYMNNYLFEEHYESTRGADQSLIYNTTENMTVTFDNLVDWMVFESKLDVKLINKILDIGCGKCDLLKSFSTKFGSADLFGIDYSPQAKIFGEKIGINNIISGDLYSETFNNNKFDIISATGVMEHQMNLSKFVEKIILLLNPGGYLLIEVPDSISILTERKDLKFKSMHDICNDEHLHHFNSSNLIAFFNKFGFTLVKERKITRGDWDDINIIMEFTGQKQIENKIYISQNHTLTSFQQQQQAVKQRFQNIIGQYNKIAIYGAGWHTTKVLPSYYELDFNRIKKIFDQDNRKMGKHIYGTEICLPEERKLNEVEAIIISSINMGDSINAYLSNNVNSNTKIINLYE